MSDVVNSRNLISFELSKLAPVAGQILLLQVPIEASQKNVMNLVDYLIQAVPQGVHVACIDSNFRLQVTNVPELVAMLQKPDVTH